MPLARPVSIDRPVDRKLIIDFVATPGERIEDCQPFVQQPAYVASTSLVLGGLSLLAPVPPRVQGACYHRSAWQAFPPQRGAASLAGAPMTPARATSTRCARAGAQVDAGCVSC